MTNHKTRFLALLFYNLHINDIPNYRYYKFIYANHIALSFQEKTFELCKINITKDLSM